MKPASQRPGCGRAAADRRELVRVMKVLSRAAAEVTSQTDGLRLESVGNRTLRLSPAVLERLTRDDLARWTGDGRLEATACGLAWLRRALAGADGFAAQHRETVSARIDMAGSAVAVTLDARESPLAWLARRRRPDGAPWIDAAQVAAGERLRADYTRGGLIARVTADWSATMQTGRRGGGRGGRGELADAVLDARARVQRALGAVGPELAGVLVDVCCELRGLETVERARGWPARSAKVILALALSRLAAHYGLAERARGADGGRPRHWGAEDYRPRIEG